MKKAGLEWWKNAVVYQIYTRSFLDSNGDGVGDFGGVIQKLDTLKDLGVDVIWLSPFCESPNDDNGYDISDYYAVQKEFGTMKDMEQLIRVAGEKGMKVMMDLVINHTSDEHPWFVESRSSLSNPKRDWYIWAPPKSDGSLPSNWDSFFGGKAWELDPVTGEYYCHIFSKKQPDLNWRNPEIRAELHKVAEFWIKKGIAAFRLDAIHLIGKPEGLDDVKVTKNTFFHIWENRSETHNYLHEFNKKVFSPHEIFTVGETGGTNSKTARLYTERSRHELDTIFHFNHVHLPDPRNASSILKDFHSWHKALSPKAWDAVFLSNHDLARQVSVFGHEGLWRERSAQAIATFLLTSWGTPFIYQGEEYGFINAYFNDRGSYRDHHFARFVDELKDTLGGIPDEAWNWFRSVTRDNSRVPLAWDGSMKSGFTTGEPWMPIHPSFKEINASADSESRTSVFSWYKKLIQERKTRRVWVDGDYRPLERLNDGVITFTRKNGTSAVLVLISWRDREREVGLPSRLRGKKLSNYRLIMGNYTMDKAQENKLPVRFPARPVLGESLTEKTILRPWEVRIFLVE